MFARGLQSKWQKSAARTTAWGSFSFRLQVQDARALTINSAISRGTYSEQGLKRQNSAARRGENLHRADPSSRAGNGKDSAPKESPSAIKDIKEFPREFRHTPLAKRLKNPRAAVRVEQSPEFLPRTHAESEFLFGHSVVEAALSAHRRTFYVLYIHSRADREKEGISIRELARRRDIKVVPVGSEWNRLFDRISEGRPHNGCILEASPLPEPRISALQGDVVKPTNTLKGSFQAQLILTAAQRSGSQTTATSINYNSYGWRYPVVLLLDSVLDPQNLGSIYRSALWFGVDALILPTRHCAPLSPVAMKAASGAVEALPTLRAPNINQFLGNSVTNGWKVHAAVSPFAVASRAVSKMLPSGISKPVQIPHSNHHPARDHPIILMLGGEESGIRKELLGHVHELVEIPSAQNMRWVGLDSLNMGVAAALLCAEFTKKPTF